MFYVKQDYNKNLYFIAYRLSSDSHDRIMARILNLETEEYRDNLINNFNGICKENEVFFRTILDAQNAIEWVNSVLIMNEMLVK